MKNKKITTLCLSLFIALGLVSCGAIDSKEIIEEQPIETFIAPNIESHGMKVNRLSTGTDSNNHEYQTFSFVVVPSSSVHKSCSASISFADQRQNGSSYLTATVDNQNQTCTITMLAYFDSVATLRLQNDYYSNVYADITIRLLPRYHFEMNSFSVEQLYISSGDTAKVMPYLDQNLSVVMETNTETQTNEYANNIPNHSWSWGFQSGLSGITNIDWSTSNAFPDVSDSSTKDSYGDYILRYLVEKFITDNVSFCFTISDLITYCQAIKDDIGDLFNMGWINPQWHNVDCTAYVNFLESQLATNTRTVNGSSYGYFLDFSLDLSHFRPWLNSSSPLYEASQNPTYTGTAAFHFEMFQDVQSITAESLIINF